MIICRHDVDVSNSVPIRIHHSPNIHNSADLSLLVCCCYACHCAIWLHNNIATKQLANILRTCGSRAVPSYGSWW